MHTFQSNCYLRHSLSAPIISICATILIFEVTWIICLNNNE